MPETGHRYCEIALPVPIDRLFTYEFPLPLRFGARAGSRVLVPFGARKLTGVVARLHNDAPAQEVREVMALLDEQPVLDGELLRLGTWIAEYYCAPIGEVFKGMLPLAGEFRRSKRYSLTHIGREVARQLIDKPDSGAPSRILAALEERPLSLDYLATKVEGARTALQGLLKRGWVAAEEIHEQRDPLRARAERLQAEFLSRPDAGVKLKTSQRELLAFLELHPGPHNLAELGEKVKGASEAARALARQELIKLNAEALYVSSGFDRPVPVLNEDQQNAFSAIENALDVNVFKAFLLQGVTGSGKTEVYLRSIESVLERGKNALLLVPEIALTPSMAGQFFHRFGKQVAILHSAFGDIERAEQWRRIRNGQARVVVGTRSGVFAPVQNLGLVIIDEEHDGSYKQQETPRYHGRDVALMRAKEAGAVAVLGSATPSVETRYNADHGKYTLLSLPERIARRPLPEVRIIDMRVEFLETRQQAIFSRKLLEEMQARLAHGQQTILLLNRRGFSSFMICRACGERLMCANCSVALTHHKRDRRMLCHYCGYAEKIPSECPRCGSDYIQFLGTGSERVENELHQHFPNARIARLDRDSVGGKSAYEQVLDAFRNGDIDILVGTQMIAKGHDIPNVTLVGVVLADIGLGMPDFRAAERSFQLLTQAAGRAGRGDLPGRVIIQTLNPEHYAIKFAAAQDYEGFYKKEIEFRKWLRYPPFAAFANVLVRAEKQEQALRMSTQLGYLLNPPPEGVRAMGPAEAPMTRLKNEFRYQILLKAGKRAVLRETLKNLRRFAESEKWSATALVIDVDPISLM
ncbi:MAG: primosomal protein N' [Acidobacteriaceae bacterium]|nr:primosomal protein N' [Acidobacteriaceae bacterium]MBV9767030.1 primosomal protein N' [Acidobacteriaceae bacterium]